METIISHGATALPPRFWAKVHKTDGCWEWTAAKSPEGYGLFWLDGKLRSAHRLTYAEVNGPIPDGMDIDHRCHNRACVNPRHLRVVTRKQNMEHQKGAQVNSKSGVRGVSWNKARGKWVAQVKHNGRQIYLGLFVRLADAEAAVIAKRNELFTHNDHDRILERKGA